MAIKIWGVVGSETITALQHSTLVVITKRPETQNTRDELVLTQVREITYFLHETGDVQPFSSHGTQTNYYNSAAHQKLHVFAHLTTKN